MLAKYLGPRYAQLLRNWLLWFRATLSPCVPESVKLSGANLCKKKGVILSFSPPPSGNATQCPVKPIKTF
ncbi:hypothetical protein JD844_034296 [Phrynosoma platyrhinos]|uniref:Uncharacterized protein n=1 Tax=Phrynosoma platyrhinos TaxID=52577 RepID=A0ABQ7T8T2_PHRPL|nr:hypothetical protein JD844_034296 [Phrynosoma platyrhinos]